MKRFAGVLLNPDFLFGAFALPGKVCPSAPGRPVARAAEADLPPCPRAAHQSPSATPCDQMVFCLVPKAERSAVLPPALPAPTSLWVGRTLETMEPELQKAQDAAAAPMGLGADDTMKDLKARGR